MATVFLAEDLKHRRRVAIKVLRPELTAMLGPERFLREIEISARLQHPHILTLLDSGEALGQLYYVMPYVEGESLRERLERERQLPVEEALGLAREVADALDHAHRAGVVHRDIKPENILLQAGHAVVADFGIARAVWAAGGTKLTTTRTTVGTPAYMSPEQVMGSANLDGRSDLYSLGCVLYEMLAGVPPFAGATEESFAHQHLSVTPAPVTSVRPSVPKSTASALARSLAKTPADRFNTAADFAEALLAPESTPAPTPVPRLAFTAAAVAIIALAIIAWLLRPTRAPVNPLENGEYSRLTDFEGTENDASVSRDGRFVVFRSDRDGPLDTWVSQIGSGSFVNLTHGTRAYNNASPVRNSGFPPDGAEIWLSGIIRGDRLRLIPSMGGPPRAFLPDHAVTPVWSPDGSKLVFHTFDPGDPMSVADRTGADPRQIFTLGPGGHN